MFFFLDYQISTNKAIDIELRVLDANLVDPLPNILYLQQAKQRLVKYKHHKGTLVLLGDPIGECSKKQLDLILTDPGVNESHLYKEVKGHFNWFFLNTNGLQCGSGFGAIFPVFYAEHSEGIYVSSTSFYLAKYLGNPDQDRQNLLERLLFNYPLFESTWWQQIKRLPAHCRLIVNNNKQAVHRNFQLSNYFGAPEQRTKRDLREISDFFAKEAVSFMPEETFGISFTGGFDGRTLVAAARNADRPFFAYSFGRPDSTDLSFPAQQAQKLKLDYQPILLDENYVQAHALSAAQNWMRLTEYNGNFGRPHYEYAARQLGQRTNYILTGNFGSELFRALHIAGVMMSESLIYYFACTDDSWKDDLRARTQRFDPTYFSNALDSLIAKLEQYRASHQGWDSNQRFYDFVFNEIFRKYFGPEIIMQSAYLRNRTPYLNLSLFERLNQSIWSGVHARLFEKWKTKRLKGQLFYAQFIRQTDTALYKMATNKGYSPADVGEKWRWPLLLSKVVWKKYGPSTEIDDNATNAFFQTHYASIKNDIQSPNMPAFMHQCLQQSLIDMTKEENVPKWIKYYSIIAGWQAAAMNNIPSVME